MNEIFNDASKKRTELDAPTRLFPRCHPDAFLDVFVDSKTNSIVLCCSQCDRLVATIKAKEPYGN